MAIREFGLVNFTKIAEDMADLIVNLAKVAQNLAGSMEAIVMESNLAPEAVRSFGHNREDLDEIISAATALREGIKG
jgi:ABC-type transporter Mla subunit MlaD